MKKVLIPLLALMTAMSVQAQNPDRSPNEAMPPLQTATMSRMPAKAAAITPTETQMWWGYYSEGDTGNSQYGYNQSVTIDAFIYVPGGTEMVSGSTIKAVRAWFGSDISNVSDFKVWISRSVPASGGAADYVQQVSTSQLTNGANEFVLNTPYVVDNGGFYVGYTATTTGRAYFISVCDTPTPNAFYYRRSNNGSVVNYSDDGRLALQLLLDGGTYPTNCATVKDFGQSTVFKGQSATIPVTIVNKGKNAISSISYVITTNGSSPTAETTLQVGSLSYNGERTLRISFASDADARKYEKTVTITKVNGMTNNYRQNSASGSLITVTEQLTSLPVVEEFTGTWCGYCPYGTVGMQNAHDKYGDKVALIAVHGDDVMAISPYEPVISKYVSGYPSSRINREGESIYPYYLVNYIDAASQRATVGTIELSATWADEAQGSVKLDTKTKFVYSDDNANYGIAFVLVEDGLKGTGSGWSQSNYLSGESGDSDMTFWYNSPSTVSGIEYNHVAVAGWDLLNGIDGSVGSSVVAGVEQKYSFTGDLSQFANIQDKSRLTAIALLINRSNGTIVNAAQTKVGTSSPVNIDPSKGDVNGDGKVDVADIASIISIMAAQARVGGAAGE